VITKTKKTTKELPHPLYNQRVRITNAHPDIIDTIGVMRGLRTMDDGTTRYLVSSPGGDFGYLVEEVEPLIPDSLDELCERIIEVVSVDHRAASRNHTCRPEKLRFGIQRMFEFLMENPAHAERIARIANEEARRRSGKKSSS
jgi:hypothetical protein